MNKTVKKGLFPYIFLLAFIIICLFIFNSFNQKVNELTVDEFMNNLNTGKIELLEGVYKTRTNTIELTGKIEGYEESETFILSLPYSEVYT